MTAVFLRYQGEGQFEPANKRQAQECDKQFVVGEVHQLEEAHSRSSKTHNHEFAFVHQAWKTLPEVFAAAPFAQSPDHLRRYALIITGWSDTQSYVCGSNAEALRWAANLRPLDEFSIVTVKGSIVERRTAKSQSMRAMGRDDFKASKRAILDYIEDLISVPSGTLAKEGIAA
jgi:hypothetical protein